MKHEALLIASTDLLSPSLMSDADLLLYLATHDLTGTGKGKGVSIPCSLHDRHTRQRNPKRSNDLPELVTVIAEPPSELQRTSRAQLSSSNYTLLLCASLHPSHIHMYKHSHRVHICTHIYPCVHMHTEIHQQAQAHNTHTHTHFA